MALMKTSVTDLARQLLRLSLQTNYTTTGAICVARSASFWSPLYSKPEAFISPEKQRTKTQDLLLGGVRCKHSKKPNYKVAKEVYKDQENAIHCHGFSYYPRFPNHQDPPIEPSKLFMVKRIRSCFGCPRWEKKLIRRLKLEDPNNIIVLKNSEENNKMLYGIKHLIEIKPITAPYGLPDKPENGFLKENGEFVAYNPLVLHGEDVTYDDARSQLVEYHQKHIGGETLKKRLHNRWYSRYDII